VDIDAAESAIRAAAAAKPTAVLEDVIMIS
jgi:hypothetical protein